MPEPHHPSHTSDNLPSDIFQLTEHFDFGTLHFRRDKQTGLHAIVAIHNTTLGPALGGCRFIPYDTSAAAILDAMRLARAMSYKSAIAGLKLGGGKSVIIKHDKITDREALFTSFGKFVDDIGGRYITAMDSGTSEQDMNIIAQQTNYVASQSQPGGKSGDPSPYTAQGVVQGIKAAVKHQLKTDELKEIHVVIQGVGNVGYNIAKILHQQGARLTVADINPQAVARCVEEFAANSVDYNEAASIECDVFAPCALGGIINDTSIQQLKTSIIAGAANNQLARLHHGEQLRERGILYAPDYVINAGGLIQAATLYLGGSEKETEKKVNRIHDQLLEIFTRAEKQQRPTNEITDHLAKEILGLA
jgi:leucine dehydrogenase